MKTIDANLLRSCPHQATMSGNIPIHQAAMTGNIESLHRIIKQNKSQINNVCDCFGRTALFWAIESGQINAAKTLIENNARFTNSDNRGRTPFYEKYAMVKVKF
jgi:ankyrin repeat protein